MALIFHHILIELIKFKGNTAEDYGGSVYITAGVHAHLEDNTFTNIDNTQSMRPSTGDIVESRGSLFMRRCRFDVVSAVSEIPVIAHRASGDEAPLITDEVMIKICHKPILKRFIVKIVQITS